MHVGFGLASDIDKDGTKIVNDFDQSIMRYFADRDYGPGIEHITIVFEIFSPKFDSFFKPWRPRFREIEKSKPLRAGDPDPVIWYNTYLYPVRVNFGLFTSLSAEDATKLLAEEVFKSLENFDKLPKKVKDFDKDRFKADMEQFLVNKGWLGER